MTREFTKHNGCKPTNKFANLRTNPNNDNHHHKIVHFEPFSLFSLSDKSIKKAIELVESASINRARVCVISVISKDALGESSKNYLVQSILSKNNSENKRRQSKNDNNIQSPTLAKADFATINKSYIIDGSVNNNEDIYNKDVSSIAKDESEKETYENQVIGHVDSKTDVIVMNLTSFLEINKLQDLSDRLGDTRINEETTTTLLDIWPKWNQNLLKTLLILFLMSHIVVFYNPEPCIDYNLVEIFRILEILRLKSQTRITDLLEIISSKQIFSQQWIRQGRIACPRALFVCDTCYLNYQIKQSDIINIKRDLEDQIYKLLKKSQIIYRSNIHSSNQNQSTLLSLPEQNFVFIITRYNPNQLSEKVFDNRDEFYAKLFKSLSTEKNYLDQDDDDDDVDQRSKHSAGSLDKLASSIEKQQLITTTIDKDSKDYSVKTTHHNRFKKFLHGHITDIQNLSMSSGENQQDSIKNKKSNSQILLPRYDDFFTVLLRLKNLIFPSIESNSSITTNNLNDYKLLQNSKSREKLIDPDSVVSEKDSNIKQTTVNWAFPDERRFMDIYDLINCDELFSKVHCYKTRIAAYDFYLRNLQLQPMEQVTHEASLEPAKLFYLHHARGSACSTNLDLLIDQCNQYWQNFKCSLGKGNRFMPNYKSKGNYGRVTRTTSSLADISPLSANLSNNNSELINARSANTSQTNGKQFQQATLSMSRRSNSLKVTTICSCNRKKQLLITPSDKSKKLDRLDIRCLDST